MRKIILSFGFLSILIPSFSFAALTITPSTYDNPANVSFTGANGINKLILYSTSTASGPYCGIVAETSGNLNTDCKKAQVTPGVADFAGTLSDTWMFVQPTGFDCSGASYSSCKSAGGNAGMEEADFTITATSSGNGSSSSKCYTGLCMFSTSTDAALGNIFKMSEILLTFGLVLLIGSIIYKFVNRNKK